MRSITCAFVAFVLSAAVAGAQPQPPPPSGMPRDARPEEKKGTSRLAGRVLAADTSRPLRRAVVRLSSPELREGRAISTNAEGRWEAKDLPAGRYSIFISKGGYVQLQYGQRRPFEQGKPIELGEGQTLDKLDVTLPRGSVITGRVIDEFGDPVSGARVSAMRHRFMQGDRRLMPLGGDATDDLGQYRLHGLPPGDYYVAAMFQTAFGMEVSGDRSGYATTYYPGTAAVAEAQRVPVSLGQETAEITFALAPIRVATVAGIATNSSGKPIASESIVLRPADPAFFGGGPMPGFGRTHPDGTFTISNIPPGEYRLEARVLAASDGGGFREGPAAEFASLPVSVSDRDITGLTIVTAPTGAASGTVVFDTGPPAGFVPGALTILGMPEMPAMTFMLGGTETRVKEDWTFQAKGLSGRRFLRVVGLPPGWAVKSIVANDQDVTDSVLEFKPGETIGGLEITLTQNLPSISGVVEGERDAPVEDYVVVAFASDERKWGPQTRFVRTARPDQSGKFMIKTLPPEEYLLVAIDALEPGEEGDPELLQRLRRLATTVRLADGEAKTVSLKLSPLP